MKNEVIGIPTRDFFISVPWCLSSLISKMMKVPICEIEFINVYEAVTHSSDKCCRSAYGEMKNSFSRPGFQFYGESKGEGQGEETRQWTMRRMQNIEKMCEIHSDLVETGILRRIEVVR